MYDQWRFWLALALGVAAIALSMDGTEFWPGILMGASVWTAWQGGAIEALRKMRDEVRER